MGELVAGTPALVLTTAVSLPLDLVSALSLLYRAVPGSGLDPWLIATRRQLPAALQADLDLLHGFSGRLLYYVEEPVLRFEPLRPDHLDAGFDELLAFLDGLPPAAYRVMVIHAWRGSTATSSWSFRPWRRRTEAVWRAGPSHRA